MPYNRESNAFPEAVAARRKWNAENLDRLSISLRKGKKTEIQAAAEEAGVSVNAWIGQAIEEKLAQK